jgi:hypothetical protein
MQVEGVPVEAERRWSPMNAGPWVRNAPHVLQQTSHFRTRQRLIRLHRSPACGHEREMVTPALDGFERCPVFVDVLKEVKKESAGVVTKQARCCRDAPRVIDEVQFKSDASQPFGPRMDTFDGACIKVERYGDEAPLALPQRIVMAQPFVSNPFMQRVLVDEKQFFSCFHQHVRSSELTEGLHRWKVVQLTFQGSFLCWSTRSIACVPMEVPFGFRKGRCHRVSVQSREGGLWRRGWYVLSGRCDWGFDDPTHARGLRPGWRRSRRFDIDREDLLTNRVKPGQLRDGSSAFRFGGHGLKRVGNGTLEAFEHAPCVTQADLTLGWMDVDVHFLCGQVEVKHRDRMPADHKPGSVAPSNGLEEGSCRHRATVHKHVNVIGLTTRDVWCADPSSPSLLSWCRFVVGRGAERKQFTSALPQEVVQPVFHHVNGRNIKGDSTVQLESESNSVVCHRVVHHHVNDPRVFGLGPALKREPGGDVREEALDGHGGTSSTTSGLDVASLAFLHADLSSLHAFTAAGEGEVAHHPNGCQGLAAEAHRMDGGQVLLSCKFGRGVAVEGEAEVLWEDAVTIVLHANHVEPTAFDAYLNAGGAGIDAVLDQFLHDLSRPFNNLAGSDVPNRQLVELNDA